MSALVSPRRQTGSRGVHDQVSHKGRAARDPAPRGLIPSFSWNSHCSSRPFVVCLSSPCTSHDRSYQVLFWVSLRPSSDGQAPSAIASPKCQGSYSVLCLFSRTRLVPDSEDLFVIQASLTSEPAPLGRRLPAGLPRVPGSLSSLSFLPKTFSHGSRGRFESSLEPLPSPRCGK